MQILRRFQKIIGKQEEKIQSENEGYFNEGYLKGLEKSYKGSKEKINDAANKENKKLQDALDAAK